MSPARTSSRSSRLNSTPRRLAAGALDARGVDEPAPVGAPDRAQRARAAIDVVGVRRDRADRHRDGARAAAHDGHLLELDVPERGQVVSEPGEAVAEGAAHAGAGELPG